MDFARDVNARRGRKMMVGVGMSALLGIMIWSWWAIPISIAIAVAMGHVMALQAARWVEAQTGFTSPQQADVLSRPPPLHASSAGVPDDEPVADQARDVPSLFASQYAEGCDLVVGGVGRLGFDPSNPIPVNGPRGETVYLSLLRSRSGAPFLYHRLGSVPSAQLGKPVDAFEVAAVDASERHVLYLAMYHMRRTRLAPEGMHLKCWGRMDSAGRAMAKVDLMGVRFRVPSFPYDLPGAVAACLTRCGLPDAAGPAAEHLEALVERERGNWELLARPQSAMATA